MKVSYDANKDVIADTFEAEYIYYVKKEPVKAINKLKEILRTKKGLCLNYTAEMMNKFCKNQKMLSIYRDTIKNSKDFVEDKNYVFE